MKKILTTVFLILALNLYPQNNTILKPSRVDKRVELLSIVFRLADSQEYNAKDYPNYIEEIENHFGPYKNHELINYIKEELRSNGIGFDAVMNMAIHLTEPPNMKPIKPFSKIIPEKRWGTKRATKFLRLLNQFYKDAGCEDFFNHNFSRYQIISTRFSKIYKNLDLKWYQDFYGQAPKGEFRIINAVGNGPSNYGPKIILPNKKEIIYAIMGISSMDSLGVPKFEMNRYFPTLLHEFNHSFINYTVEKYHNELQESGERIFDVVKNEMNKIGYGNWKTMYSESLVRASVIKYLKDHNSSEKTIKDELNQQLNNGFLWTENLVSILELCDNQRGKYPTIDSFMPKIIEFFDQTDSKVDVLKKQIDSRRPQVISIEPFNNNDNDVNFNINQIIIAFDKELNGRSYGIAKGNKDGKSFPIIGKKEYSKDNTKLVIEVTLKPNTEYHLLLTGRNVVSKDGFGMNDYEVNFKTKRAQLK